MMTKQINVGDAVVYNGVEAFDGYDGCIMRGQIGVVKHIIEDMEPWPYLCDFGIGGLDSGTSLNEIDLSGLAPMSAATEISLYVKE